MAAVSADAWRALVDRLERLTEDLERELPAGLLPAKGRAAWMALDGACERLLG